MTENTHKPLKLASKKDGIAHLREAQRLSVPQPGDQMPDGTFYGGISPSTNELFWVAPRDAERPLQFDAALEYAENLAVAGKTGFALPTKEEMEAINALGEKGLLTESFNTSASFMESWYWCLGESGAEDKAWSMRFGRGTFLSTYKTIPSAVRCVRRGKYTP